MNRKKIIILAVSTLTAATIAVGGTLAYFTSKTQTAKNTFTVGNVSITMDEAAVTQNGIDWIANENAPRVKEGNTYTSVMPASKLAKDPTIKVTDSSEDCYVGMKVVVTNYDKFTDTAKAAFDKMFTPAADNNECVLNNGWKLVKSNAGTYILGYTIKVDDDNNDAIPAAFDGIEIPATFATEDIESLASFNIEVTGEAIQAAGFDNSDLAFDELFK